jgi:hypothetical protein
LEIRNENRFLFERFKRVRNLDRHMLSYEETGVGTGRDRFEVQETKGYENI